MKSDPLCPAVMDEAALKIAAGEKLEPLLQQLGISRRTLFRWKKRTDFQKRVSELRAEMTRACCGRFAASMADAADALTNLLKSGNDSMKLGAARQLFALGVKVRDSFELEERIQEMEKRLELKEAV